jgi:hypothetical protein
MLLEFLELFFNRENRYGMRADFLDFLELFFNR